MLLREITSPAKIVLLLIGQIITRPAWLMFLFLMLACLIPFAGGMRPFRGDAFQMLDPFGFSLLTPSRADFGPYSLLALTGLLLMPSLIIFWRRSESSWAGSGLDIPFRNGILPLSAIAAYFLFLLVSLPLLVKSPAFPTVPAIIFTLLDLLLTSSFLAFVVDLAIIFTPWTRMKALVAIIIAAAAHLLRCLADAFVIARETRDIIAEDWSILTVHALLLLVVMTIYALPLPQFQAGASIRNT